MGRAILPSLLLLGCLACLVPGTRSSIMAVDLGSEFMKVALVQPGRTPISIVINEISKRKTPALVGFVGRDRLVGEEAAGLATRHPTAFVANLPALLGRSPDDLALAALAAQGLPLPRLVPAANRTGALALDFGEAGQVTPEELAASLLQYAAGIARAASATGTAPRDLVLLAPAHYGPRRRQALLDAAAAAGLNVLGLVSPAAAAALQYGIDRTATFASGGPQHVLLYDLGSGGLEVALVRFSTYPDRKGAPASQVEIMDMAWDEGAGTQLLESLLLRHFMAQAGEALGEAGADLAASPRAVAKLRAGVKRALRVLSANLEAPLSVEELHAGRDFRSSISREALERLAGDYWARVTRPALDLLARNGVAAADLAAVELLGGGSRIPRVKAELSQALGGRALDVHLDADEAVVLGAGLVAANRSTQFRVRPFGLVDKVPYGVSYALDDDTEVKPLVPAMKRVPSRRAVNLLAQAAEGRDAVGLRLFLSGPASEGQARELGAWRVEGLRAALAAHDNVTRVAFHARVDDGGCFHVDGADFTVSRLEYVEAKGTLAGAPGTNATNGSAASDVTGGGGAEAAVLSGGDTSGTLAGAPDSNATTAGEGVIDATSAGTSSANGTLTRVPRVRTSRLSLNVTGGLAHPGLTPEQLAGSRAVLARLAARDTAKRAAAQAKNDLEAYVLEAASWSAEDDDVKAVARAGELATLGQALEEAEDWLYGEGDAAGSEEYVAKLEALKALGDGLRTRGRERSARPQAVAEARNMLEVLSPIVEGWAAAKPWLPEYEVGLAKEKLAELQKWLTQVEAVQAKKKATDEPAFTSAEVNLRLKVAAESVSMLDRRPAPPTPKPTTDATADGAKKKAAKKETGTNGKAKPSQGPGEPEAEVQAPEEPAEGMETVKTEL
ncbi:HSP70G [Auxenochlorella protothecoides x Auxenochlorella symbiontica]